MMIRSIPTSVARLPARRYPTPARLVLLFLAALMTANPACRPAAREPVAIARAPDEERSAPQPIDTQAVASKPRIDVDSPREVTPPTGQAVSEPTRRRLLLLTPGGPVLMELLLSAAGMPYQQVVAQAVDVLRDLLDVDRNGSATWAELAGDRLLASRDGMESRTSRRQMEGVERGYDGNRNGLVDAPELLHFLNSRFKNQGDWLVVAPFTDEKDIVRGWLDEDGDDRLAGDEIAAAVERLRQRDADGDDVLWLADFPPISLTIDVSRYRQGSEGGLFVLPPTAGWDALLYALQERFAYGKKLTTADLPERHGAVANLDQDKDRVISPDELSQLLDATPDVIVQLRLSPLTLPSPPQTGERVLLEPLKSSDTAEPADVVTATICKPTGQEGGFREVRGTGNRVTIERSDGAIEIVVAPALVRDQSIEKDVRRQFQEMDIDQDGLLSQAEGASIGLLADQLSAADINNDMQIDIEELEGMVRKLRTLSTVRLTLQLSSAGNSYFAAFDENRNGRIDAREIANAPATLAKLDTNEDGQLDRDDTVGRLALVVLPGSPYPSFSDPVNASLRTEPADGGAPQWFVGMDANRDGELSATEFLGRRSDVERLDQDRDGFVEVDEVRQVLTCPPEQDRF
jgi:Ca2+-binding EF-hand superfamily protein